MNKLTKRQIKTRNEKERRAKQLKLYKTLISYAIGLILFFIVAINVKNFVLKSIDSIKDYNKVDERFTFIEADDCKFKMYMYSQTDKSFTSILIDESLKDFDLEQLDFKYDEKFYIKSEREIIDFYRFAKTDRTKLYVLIDSKHKDLIDTIEKLRDFESIIDVKKKTEIYNTGNPKAQNTIVFVDGTLNIVPKNIAFWNLGIEPDDIRIIDDSNVFSSYYSKNYTKGDTQLTPIDGYNIYVIVSKNNKKLIAACKALEID
ncbi:MAG: hypothetical protein ILA02_01755 [Clostridia bacterium]|nr:hypothetical protein [Clostridia bacterium]